mmetsp:Transcript_17706/g.57835  ORF Transcript_17706/g.57835 Transcript_17706/m.57835 type:complete len:212 (-) Transcript_17706:59-694(-)
MQLAVGRERRGRRTRRDRVHEDGADQAGVAPRDALRGVQVLLRRAIVADEDEAAACGRLGSQQLKVRRLAPALALLADPLLHAAVQHRPDAPRRAEPPLRGVAVAHAQLAALLDLEQRLEFDGAGGEDRHPRGRPARRQTRARELEAKLEDARVEGAARIARVDAAERDAGEREAAARLYGVVDVGHHLRVAAAKEAAASSAAADRWLQPR